MQLDKEAVFTEKEISFLREHFENGLVSLRLRGNYDDFARSNPKILMRNILVKALEASEKHLTTISSSDSNYERTVDSLKRGRNLLATMPDPRIIFEEFKSEQHANINSILTKLSIYENCKLQEV